MPRRHSAQKVKVDFKSYLIDHLAELYDRKCAKCGTTKNLTVDFTVGQEYLEFEHYQRLYADMPEDIWYYYLSFFADESEYLGLICTKCKKYNKPDHPTLDEIWATLDDLFEQKQYGKIEEYLEKYPQAKPIHMRTLRLQYYEQGLL